MLAAIQLLERVGAAEGMGVRGANETARIILLGFLQSSEWMV
jgi:hypothetical protein